MALVSPGVEVSIIDQSQYLPAASSSVPLLLLATAQNKINAAGTGVAPATTAANANKLYQVTSQRDLVSLFGNPFFYKTTDGTSIQGYELNEYGLLSAYSLLGSTNRAYILRADIDLAGLVGQLGRPVGEPSDGTYWLDTTNSTWGIFEFNQSTGKFTNKVPRVIVDANQLTSGVPKDLIGNIGDYAVVPSNNTSSESTYFYKTSDNMWVALGSSAWASDIHTVQGTGYNPTLVEDHTFTISVTDTVTDYLITVPASPNNNIDGIVDLINAIGSEYIVAENVNDKLVVNLSYITTSELANPSITFTNGTGTALTQLGITSGFTYYQPQIFYGTSAQMPLWTASQDEPHPTGSVWIKTSTAGSGVNLVVSKYNSASASWIGTDVGLYQNTTQANTSLDSTGGKNIPAGTVIAQYETVYSVDDFPIILRERLATGATLVTGSVVDPEILVGSAVGVSVSVPNSNTLTVKSFTTTGTTLDSFVQDWILANIPYTTCSITTDNTIQISHTLGGEIIIIDQDDDGVFGGTLAALGLTPSDSINITDDNPYELLGVQVIQDATSGGGSGFNAYVDLLNGVYHVQPLANPVGVLYDLGDTITIEGTQFGVGSTSPANDLVLSVTGVNGGQVTEVDIYSGTGVKLYETLLSNWVKLSYIANEGAPATMPANGTQWFYSTATQVDIMVNKGGEWFGYKNVNYDSTGHPSSTGANATDPLGPILSTTPPTTQSDTTALVYGDLWINTGDLENYPVISRWQLVDGVDQWVQINNADQTSNNGVLFADARWSSSGAIDPINDPVPTIVSLLTSDYVDLDVPDPMLYPQGMLLWNTRRSGYNVKQFRTSYFTGANFPNAGSYNSVDPTDIANLPAYSYTWVSASGLKADGSPYMGRKAQRNLVVEALKASIATNMSIREEDTFFNLIAAPNYPELQPDMVTLNNDRNNTAYIVGDTPLRLPDSATEITNWATNKSGATATGEDGWVTRDSYLGVFYPSGISSDLTGASVVVPASHMMLRTFLRNDTVAYPWLAAAGTRRGTIDNATNIGYLDSATGEFITVKNRMSIRDVLYTNQINPLTYFTGVGLLNYGNKNSYDSQSALDRTNVARLIAYIRYRVQVAARPFVFEPNDALTRQQIAGVIQSLFVDLVAKRGLYDYLVVCDDTNNTPARIDRNELWVDIAIEPVKAAEFIYVPVRILNTGEIAGIA